MLTTDIKIIQFNLKRWGWIKNAKNRNSSFEVSVKIFQKSVIVMESTF